MAVWRTPPPATTEMLDGRGSGLGDGAEVQLFGEGANERGKMMIL